LFDKRGLACLRAITIRPQFSPLASLHRVHK
jgi:hypothetical protein